ncbi:MULTISPECIES: HU family DNA-binding protein [unclassified Marinobacter]|uniref:HU family DNA-binding protein n=1 Tax=unclassified Marinobacter TaxID=83889 RepID=UPI0026E317CE|nr:MULTISPECIES: HU family DNA-binding protein [unclassified Marinobacter]MDO6442313.1 HU family DNA-binding protein [Marinobacter sp. 2_MG-2023]MDO6822192.1 HU family DNA-binding protein [Marinobacter sp. 1_MG-2023]
MNKQELIDSVAEQTGLSKADSKKAVDAVFSTISKSLGRGKPVNLTGFGTFTVRERAARMGRNPRTGGALKIAPSKVPALRAGKKLRDTVKRSTDDPGPSDFAKSER